MNGHAVVGKTPAIYQCSLLYNSDSMHTVFSLF